MELKKAFTKTPQQLVTRMHERVHSMTGALSSVQTSERKIHWNGVDAFLLGNKGVGCGGGYHMRDGTPCFCDKCPKKLREQKQQCQLNARLLECWVSCSGGSGWVSFKFV